MASSWSQLMRVGPVLLHDNALPASPLFPTDGYALLINLKRRIVLHRFNFKAPVLDLRFSPDDAFLAVTHKHKLAVWRSTGGTMRSTAPLQQHRVYTGHYDDVTCVDWAPNGQYFVTGSRDQTARIYSTYPVQGFIPVTLGGHRDVVTGVFFVEDDVIFSTSADAAVYRWEWQEDEEAPPALEDSAGGSDSSGSDTSSDSDTSDDSDSSGSSVVDGGASSTALVPGNQRSGRGRGPRALGKTRNGHGVPAPWEDEDDATAGDAASVSSKSVLRGTWALVSKKCFKMQGARLVSSSVHAKSGLLVAGFSTGVFGVYTLPDVTPVHTLSISQRLVTSAAINPTGEWLAFGCRDLGQLLVWEWQSESYVLKQQGHFFDVNAVAYSPDGQAMATGGDDGKVKLWSSASGFCYVTFAEHKAPVTAVAFVGGTGGRGQAVLSASLDGTIKAFDLVRYRNFKTLVAPESVQFTCLAVDPSGDIVAAGTAEPFNIYVWNLQTGKLLDVLSGHDGPIADLAFCSANGKLASASWDGTARVWEVFKPGTSAEVFSHPADVLAVAWRPDGKQLATSSREGVIHFWNPETARPDGTISGRRDIRGGRRRDAKTAAVTSAEGKCFTSISYTGDGECIIAGGRSKYICLYAVAPKLLLRKFQMSHNRSMDAMLDELNSKNLPSSGIPLSKVEGAAAAGASALGPRAAVIQDEMRLERYMPGANRGEAASARKTPPEIRCKQVRFAPGGRAFAIASTAGLMQYSVDASLTFDPFELDETVTPEAMRVALSEQEWGRALTMALHMNEAAYIKESCNAVPVDSIDIVARTVPRVFVCRLLEHIASTLALSRAVEYHVAWASCLMKAHGATLKQRSPAALSALRGLLKPLQHHAKRLGSTGSDNTHMLQLLTHSHGAPVSGGAAAGLAGAAGGELLVSSLLPSLSGIKVHAAMLQQQAVGQDAAPVVVLGGLEFDSAGQLRAKEASDSEAGSGSDSDGELDGAGAAAAAASSSSSDSDSDSDSGSDSQSSDEDVAAAAGAVATASAQAAAHSADSSSEGSDSGADSGGGEEQQVAGDDISAASDDASGDGDEEQEEEEAARPRSRFVMDSASEAGEDEEESGASTEDEAAHSDASAGGGRSLAQGEWREGDSGADSSGSSEDEDEPEPEGDGPSDSEGDSEGGSAAEQVKGGSATHNGTPSKRGRAAAVVESSEDEGSKSDSSAASGEPVDAADVATVFKGGEWEAPPAKSARKRPARRGRAAGSAPAGGDPVLEASIASAVAFFGAPMQEVSLEASTPGRQGGSKRSRDEGSTTPAAAVSSKAPRSSAKTPGSNKKTGSSSGKKRAKTPPGVRRSGRLRK